MGEGHGLDTGKSMTRPAKNPPPLLANAYTATGTGPWALRKIRTARHHEARRAIYRWLRDQGLCESHIARLTGFDRASVRVGLSREPVASVKSPREVFNEAMRALGYGPHIWARSDWGALRPATNFAKARADVWCYMRERGLTPYEIAAVTDSCRSAVRDVLVSRGVKPRPELAR